MKTTEEGELERDPQKVSDRVVKLLIKKYSSNEALKIEDIQDVVEDALILSDLPRTAKAYIVYRRERAQLRDARRDIPEHVKELSQKSKKYFRNSLGEFIFYRTYSRWIDEEGRRETWIETVDRFMDFMRENCGSKFKDQEYEEIKEGILNHEAMPSMRLLQFAGTAVRKTNVAAYNCSFIAPQRLEDFAEIMYICMCGSTIKTK